MVELGGLRIINIRRPPRSTLFPYTTLSDLGGRRIFYPRLLGTQNHIDEHTFDWKNVLIMSWAGMRGVVSIATAMALPLVTSTGKAFPERNVILVLTFIILVVTLVGQGLSLPSLVRRLHVNTI